MKWKNSSIKSNALVKIALVAAVYIVSTISLGSLSYGTIGFRVSEMLNFLAFLDPFYVISLTIGCAISNFYSFSIVDVFVGSFATFLATYAMWKTNNMAISIIWPVLGCTFVAGELHVLYNMPFFYTLLIQAIGEASVMILGYIVFKKIIRNSNLLDKIRIKPHNKKIESIKKSML